MAKQLVIIGNGFDLACGLKSSYKDFFENYFKEELQEDEEHHKKINSAISEGDEKTSLNLTMKKFIKESQTNNFWFDWFYKQKSQKFGRYKRELVNYKWSDIESEIKFCVKHISEYYFNELKEESSDNQKIICAMNAREAKETEESQKKPSRNEFFNLLINDLKEVELEFVNYLNEVIKSENEYEKKSKRLFLKLYEDKINDNQKFEDTNTISFNYTTLPDDFEFSKHVTNIHGTLKGKDIIFGIDSFDLSSKEYQLINKFSKTYRLMRLKRENLNISPDTDIIKFYGHSLGEADYSYFQTIFDIVNLYSGETKLIFYFSVYGGKTLEEVEEEIFERVWLLIQKYGETLENKDHGKNLIHKLQLENRLLIKKIEFD